MATAALRSPSLRTVNQFDTPLAGPFALDVPSAKDALGLVLGTIDAHEEAEVLGPYKNAQWAMFSQWLGYRLYVTLHFAQVESSPTNGQYGLSLLHSLWRAAVETQVNYAALQFSMFNGAAWHGMVPQQGSSWAPTLIAGKQGFYEVSLALVSRDLVANPGEWAQQQW